MNDVNVGASRWGDAAPFPVLLKKKTDSNGDQNESNEYAKQVLNLAVVVRTSNRAQSGFRKNPVSWVALEVNHPECNRTLGQPHT